MYKLFVFRSVNADEPIDRMEFASLEDAQMIAAEKQNMGYWTWIRKI